MARKRVCIRNNRSDNDSEDELQESVILQMSVEGSSVRKTRGFTRMADVWNLPPHSLIVVTFNKVHQPKRSAIGKANRSKQTAAHTAGTKSYAQHAYEMVIFMSLES
ncbi:Alpha,alpha-trehalose-phosphate synthase (UDP-forming) 1 [Senna tora]|uniref:Alpha,alpha-trehalose-phosphate synthase (UDP-forming) 1 n=1 Tax=Senna tora TaxID=362788 RepID=A0A834T2N3_9FABA|nr:Alpha,alpha-trehalose-phosphate synthase (UDP-forming) 1 [Senna tora]